MKKYIALLILAASTGAWAQNSIPRQTQGIPRSDSVQRGSDQTRRDYKVAPFQIFQVRDGLGKYYVLWQPDKRSLAQRAKIDSIRFTAINHLSETITFKAIAHSLSQASQINFVIGPVGTVECQVPWDGHSPLTVTYRGKTKTFVVR